MLPSHIAITVSSHTCPPTNHHLHQCEWLRRAEIQESFSSTRSLSASLPLGTLTVKFDRFYHEHRLSLSLFRSLSISHSLSSSQLFAMGSAFRCLVSFTLRFAFWLHSLSLSTRVRNVSFSLSNTNTLFLSYSCNFVAVVVLVKLKVSWFASASPTEPSMHTYVRTLQY